MAVTINGTTGIAVPLGTAAAPGVVNTTSATTGIYNPTSTTLGLSTNGTNAVYIDASQNVGIGTTSPGYKLTTVGASAAGGIYTATSNTDATAGSLAGYLGVANGTNNYFALFQAVGGATTFSNAGAAGLTIQTAQAQPLIFSTTAAERMRIDSSGNVGIGTSTPGYTLDVRATTGSISATSNTGTNYAKLQCNNFGGSYQFGIDNSAGSNFGSGIAYSRVIWNDSSTAPTILYTSSTERMRIDSSGNVGIGTSSPNTRLQVYNAATSAFTGTSPGAFIVTDSTNTVNYFTSIDFNTSNGPSIPLARIGMGYTSGGSTLSFGTSNVYASGITNTAMTIDPTGNLLVGTTSQGGSYNGRFVSATGSGLNAWLAKDAQNNGAIASFVNSSNALAGTITISGTTTTYGTSSDYRLKKNVQPITTGLATVAALKPVTYDWISDQSAGEGFIAHELQDVIPFAVIGEKDAVNEDGSIKPQGIDPAKIVVHLVAAIKELSAEVEALKAKVGA